MLCSGAGGKACDAMFYRRDKALRHLEVHRNEASGKSSEPKIYPNSSQPDPVRCPLSTCKEGTLKPDLKKTGPANFEDYLDHNFRCVQKSGRKSRSVSSSVRLRPHPLIFCSQPVRHIKPALILHLARWPAHPANHYLGPKGLQHLCQTLRSLRPLQSSQASQSVPASTYPRPWPARKAEFKVMYYWVRQTGACMELLF